MEKPDFAAMTPTQIRAYMTALGWNSDDRMTDMGWGKGKYGYSVWFERWEWHGKHADKANYGAHIGSVSEYDIKKTIIKAAEQALEAWALFTDPGRPPNVNAYGEFMNSPVSKYKEHKNKHGRMVI